MKLKNIRSPIFLYLPKKIFMFQKYSPRSIVQGLKSSTINKNNLINFKNNKRDYTIFSVTQLNSINTQKIKQNKIIKKQGTKHSENLLVKNNNASNNEETNLIKNTNKKNKKK